MPGKLTPIHSEDTEDNKGFADNCARICAMSLLNAFKSDVGDLVQSVQHIPGTLQGLLKNDVPEGSKAYMLIAATKKVLDVLEKGAVGDIIVFDEGLLENPEVQELKKVAEDIVNA